VVYSKTLAEPGSNSQRCVLGGWVCVWGAGGSTNMVVCGGGGGECVPDHSQGYWYRDRCTFSPDDCIALQVGGEGPCCLPWGGGRAAASGRGGGVSIWEP
jgi:hypothetical protein